MPEHYFITSVLMDAITNTGHSMTPDVILLQHYRSFTQNRPLDTIDIIMKYADDSSVSSLVIYTSDNTVSGGSQHFTYDLYNPAFDPTVFCEEIAGIFVKEAVENYNKWYCTNISAPPMLYYNVRENTYYGT